MFGFIVQYSSKIWAHFFEDKYQIVFKNSRMKNLFAWENNLSCFFSFRGATWE